MSTGTPESILLFDESAEYLDMSKEEQKAYFKEKMATLNKEQVQERVALKIKRHKERMAGGLKPETQDPKTAHRNKRRNQWNLDKDDNNDNNNKKKEKQANVSKKENIKKTMSKDDNKKLNGKKVKYYSGNEKKKPEPPKPKPKFQEEGQSIRGSTKKDSEHKNVLEYVDEDDELNKNAKIQLEIKESNKKLKESMKKVTKYSVIKGYSTLKKKELKRDNISRIGKIQFNRNILKETQQKLNPSLLKNKPEPPIKKNEKEKIDVSSSSINGNQALQILKWHEKRLDDYADVINTQQEFIDKLTNTIEYYSENYSALYFNSLYKDLNTIKLQDISIRKIQSIWNIYMFRKSVAAIKVQRWFRYVKNVKNVSEEVQEFIENIAAVHAATSDINNFLLSLDSKKALPLQRLKEIKQKLIKQQEVLDL